MTAQAKLMALEISDTEGKELLGLLSGDTEQRARAEAFIMRKLHEGQGVALGDEALKEAMQMLETPQPEPQPEEEEDEGTGENITFGDLVQHLQKRVMAAIKKDMQMTFLLDVLRNAHYLLHGEQAERATALMCAASKVIDGQPLDYQTVKFLSHELDTLNAERAKADCAGSA